MEKVTPPPILKFQIAPFWIALLVILATVGEGDAAASPPSNEVLTLRKILEIDTTQYLFSNAVADPVTAEKVCQEHSAKLLAIQSPEEFKALSSKLDSLRESIGDGVWTSGISFTNSTIENLLIWSSNNEPFTYSEFYETSRPGESSGAIKSKIVRNKRDKKCCDCPSTLPPFPTPPPCKKPTCQVEQPPEPICEHISPPTCSIAETPKCDVTDRKCSVDCGQCRLVEQPVCEVIESSEPRCHLKMPKCEPRPPSCDVVGESICRAVQDKCDYEGGECVIKIKRCNNSCADRECTTTTPPCTTVQPPCTTTTTCRPDTPDNCTQQCRQKRSEKDARLCLDKCPPSGPTTCRPETTCPPPVTDCPNPVTACSRPFVDCSPEICQSMVHICLPPKFKCPPVRIICDTPKVDCNVTCSNDPEVVCDLPEVKCSKPRVECPDAHVQCDTPISYCEPAKLNCGHPEATGCAVPNVTCGGETICPPTIPITELPGSGNGCENCGNKCSRNTVEETINNPSEVENVEQTLCVAMKPEFGFKWILQDCNLRHKYVCERKKKKGGILKGFMDNMVFG